MSQEWRDRFLFVGVIVSAALVLQAGLYIWDAVK